MSEIKATSWFWPWVAGWLFVLGLCSKEYIDGVWHFILSFLVWPMLLGRYLAEVLK